MPSKGLIFILMSVGGIVGGYVPTLFGVDALSFTSIFWSGVGSLIGIYLAVKLSGF